jgi:AcrR family transcriptional regulator
VPGSERERSAAGPGWAFAYHGAHELGGPQAVRAIPAANSGWPSSTNSPRSNVICTSTLAHCIALNDADRAAWKAGGGVLVDQVTVTGTADEVRRRLDALGEHRQAIAPEHGREWRVDDRADRHMNTTAPARSAAAERRQQQLDEVIDTAARLFARSGFGNVGMAELCDTLGMGRGQLYNLIALKENLLRLIHERFTDLLFQGADRINAMALAPADRLRQLVRHLMETIAEHQDYVWVFFNEWQAFGDSNREVCRRRRRQYQDMVENILRQGCSTVTSTSPTPTLPCSASSAWPTTRTSGCSPRVASAPVTSPTCSRTCCCGASRFGRRRERTPGRRPPTSRAPHAEETPAPAGEGQMRAVLHYTAGPSCKPCRRTSAATA